MRLEIGHFEASSAEFKHATVLFADIASSTRLVASMDAEQAMAFLAPVVDAMVEVVTKYGGTIGRTLGDGVMALFGAPQAQEGHALLACEAAIELHTRTSRFPEVRLRVGLHSGEVVIDTSANAADSERQLHGAAIHLASRVITMAAPGDTCLTADTYALAGSRYDADSLGLREARGFDTPVQVYKLLGVRQKSGTGQSRLQGVAPSTLLGRGRELAQLRQALDDVQSGTQRIVGVSAGPGTGKSRLCAEFASWCRGGGIAVFEARAQLYGHATPLQPVLEFLRSAVLHVSPNDDAATVRGRIGQHIREMGNEFHEDMALVNDFLGVTEEGSDTVAPGAPNRRARLLHVVGQMVRQLAVGPTLILIEDLHWLDSATNDFLATLIRSLAGSPALLLVNYRPSYSAPWMKSASFSELVLRDLEQGDTVRLVNELIGGQHEAVGELAIRIAERSGGNPFFAEELVRALMVADKLAARETGRSAASTIDEGAPLPATVQSVIGARIDQLHDDRKSLLQLCAILGKDFPAAVLELVTGVRPNELRRGLGDLCAAEFLLPLERAEVGWYSFRHPLIQEVAYRTQLKQTRAKLHAQVARAMQTFYESWGDEFAGLVAYHFEAAGLPIEAAHHAARAARWISATDVPQAVRQWQQVRQLMLDQPDTPDNNLLRSRASTQIVWLGWREGLTHEQAKPLMEEAMSWARESDPRVIPLLLFQEGRIHLSGGGAADQYVDCVRQALRMREGCDRPGRRAVLHAALSHGLAWAGLLNEALEANTEALAEADAIDAFDEQLLGYSAEHWASGLRARILIPMARFPEARACIERILSIQKRDLDPTVRFIVHMVSLELACALGERGPALEHSRQVAAIAAEHPSAYLRVFALAAAGLAATVRDDFEAAIASYGESLALLRSARAAMEYEPELLASMAECTLLAGRRDAALQAAQDALVVAAARTTRIPQCRAYLTLASLAMDSALPTGQDCATLLAEAQRLIEQTGARWYLPQLRAMRVNSASSWR